jgi:ankyrin repeat protein
MRRAVINSAFLLLAFLATPATPAQAEEIHRAVIDSSLESVVTLIDQNPGLLNVQDEKGKTPLNLAVELGFADIARLLVERGADVNLADQENWSPLHHAADSGDLETARLLIEKGATLNSATQVQKNFLVGGWTPLHLASLKGHALLVDLLLDHGAEVDSRDGAQRTPLILSAESNNPQIAGLLIKRGADINAQAMRGYTPILWGARNQAKEYVDLLIAARAAIAPEVLPRALEMAADAGMENLYRYTLELGCDLAAIRQEDPYLIFSAAAGGSAAIVRSLVESVFDPRLTDPHGMTPLHAAATENRIAVLEYLLGLDLDINVRNKKGESPFNLARFMKPDETVAFLTANGADTGAPQFPLFEGPYMGQPPPGDTPRMFLEGIVSGPDRAHSSITFSPDGLEAYWTEMAPPEGRVAHTRVVAGKWTYPESADIDRDPTFSPDGKRLYFIQTRPFKEGEIPGGDPDLKEEYWYRERTDTGWSAPISVGDAVNSLGVHWPCSVDRDGNLFFSEFKDKMYFSRYADGAYQTPVLLTEYLHNATLIGQGPFVAPDGSYLLFTAQDSLHISFRKDDGTWTDRINLGGLINASHINGTPRVTADGKYMFFVSAGRGRSWGIYWVSADVITRLKAEHLSGQ